MTMRERVYNFCKRNKRVSSADLDNFHDLLKRTEGNVKGLLRIHREARQLSQDGLLRRLEPMEKGMLGYDSKLAVYEFVGDKMGH